ncbi:hypothetical protein HY032_01340 [Candidatus Gottesmanbacteria bacterium]|nr:hypothetical protein [Candidatus Gottesmanbacteria bacterium]
MLSIDDSYAWWQLIPKWHGTHGGAKELPQSDELIQQRERLLQALIPILCRVEGQLRRGPLWILVDGPQGAGKTNVLGPTLQQYFQAHSSWAPEAVCTNLSLVSRSNRHTLSPVDYNDLWQWYRLDYLKILVKDIIIAQQSNQSSVTTTHWYNRERGGIVDETPREVHVSRLMVLEGIGALSDDVVRIFEESGIPYVGLIIDAPREARYSSLLATRTYRSVGEQYQLMNTVEESYWKHFPALRKNASYYISVVGDDVHVMAMV